jgi:succinate dehydrogenase / fumarate reductase iron-sulfur subunit
MSAAEAAAIAHIAPATITLRIRRQASPTAQPFWEGFSLTLRPGLTIAACLAELREGSRASGTAGTALEWGGPCEGGCRGACALLVNGQPATACGTRVDALAAGQVTIEPLSKFVVIRDLVVDREPFHDAVTALEMGAVTPTPAGDALDVALSRCTQCGICMEACPQINQRSDYSGPAVMAHVLIFNARPDGHARASERLRAIMGRGGLADCGNAQNCVQVCPFGVPLVDALGELGHQTTALWFGRPLKR